MLFSTRLFLGLERDAAGQNPSESEDARQEHADDSPLELLGHAGLGLALDESSEDNREATSEDGENQDPDPVSSSDIAGGVLPAIGHLKYPNNLLSNNQPSRGVLGFWGFGVLGTCWGHIGDRIHLGRNGMQF